MFKKYDNNKKINKGALLIFYEVKNKNDNRRYEKCKDIFLRPPPPTSSPKSPGGGVIKKWFKVLKIWRNFKTIKF